MPQVVDIDKAAAREQLINRAHTLAPHFRERAAETEERRSLPPESVADLVEAGFARALVPARFGGNELDWDTGTRAAAIIGAADASHAWCASLMMEMAQFCGYFHPDAQQALWGDGPDVPVASSVIPSATFTPDGDGFRVSGRSAWASGVNHAKWSLVAGLVPSKEGPDRRLAMIPASDYTIDDTWMTIGMRGTGSNTIVTDNVYVPATHVLKLDDLREGDGPGSRWHDGPLYRLPWLSYGPLAFITPMLGATEGAYTALRDWTRSRVTKGNGAAMAELPTVQVKLAKAAADIDAAKLLLRRVVEETLKPEPPSIELRARAMRDFAYSGQKLLEAMEAVMSLAGSAGFAESNGIQQAWRDVHFISTHISMNDSNPIHFARTELGLPPQPYQMTY